MGLFDFFRHKPASSTAASSPAPAESLGHGFPFAIEVVRASQAEECLLQGRKERVVMAAPVILGEVDAAKRMMEGWEVAFDFDAQLKLAADTDIVAWFAKAREEAEEYFDEQEQDEIHANGTAPMTRLCAGCLFHPERTDVIIATIPTDDSTTIPLHLRFGDWNACPSPHIHTAVARYWRDRFGAEIATVAGDIVEFTVSRPPSTDKEASELAMQQYLYCNDIVDQGVGSIATLGLALRKSTRWYFWWD